MKGHEAMRAARLLVLVAISLLAGFASPGPASAYWAGDGTGSASGKVATLDPPTGVVASRVANSRTVQISWVAHNAPNGADDDGFYVRRVAGSSQSPACGTSPASLTTATSCLDTDLGDGTYTYKVTAVFRSWTAQSGPSSTVSVSAPPAYKLTFSQQPTSTTAGATIAPAVTVRIEDEFGSLTDSTASVTLTVTGGGATLSGSSTQAAVAGVASFANLSMTAPGTHTLTATSAGLTGATSASFSIRAGAPSRLCVVATLPSCDGSLAVEKNSTTTTQLRIFDQYGNVATATSAITITLTETTKGGTVTPTTVTVGAGASTSGSFSITINGNSKTANVNASAPGLRSASFTVNSS